MASAWGNAWGRAWGNAWGAISEAGRRFRVRSYEKKREFKSLAEFKRWLDREEEQFAEQAQKAVRNPRLLSRPKPAELPPVVLEDAPLDFVISLQQQINEHNKRLDAIWLAAIKRQLEINDEEDAILCLLMH